MKIRKGLIMMTAFAILLGGGLIFRHLEGNAALEKEESRAEVIGGAPVPKAVNVEVMTVQPGLMKDVLVLPGETQPFQDVVLAAEQEGLVEWIGPKEGDRVKAGELLARIDVATHQAELDNARAAYELSDSLFQRRSRLFARGIISKEELEQARTERTVNQGILKQVETRYDQCFLRAPFEGFVNHLYLDAGEFAGQGAALVGLVNIDRVDVWLAVPEMDVQYLQIGDSTRIHVDALSDLDFEGKIDFIALKADPTTRTFRVRIRVNNQANEIRPGMIARIELVRRLVPDALAVPLFSLVNKGGERVAFVEKDGVAEGRRVSLGFIDGPQVQVTAGLNPGDHLIVTGQTEVEDGMKVVAQ